MSVNPTAISVIPNNSGSPNTPVSSNQPAPAAPAGVASAPSSITSSVQEAGKGFIAQISAWISNIVDKICKCLANLFGWFSRSTPPTPVPDSVAEPVPTDNEILNLINDSFVTNSNTILSNEVVNYALNLFGKIQSPTVKMRAFQTILNATNATDDFARQFYNVLPDGTGQGFEASKASFRWFIWDAGGENENSLSFADDVIATAIRGPLAKQAVQNLINALATPNAPPTTGPISAGGVPGTGGTPPAGTTGLISAGGVPVGGAPGTGGTLPAGTTIPVTSVTVQPPAGTPIPVTPVTAQSTVGTPIPVTPVTAQSTVGTPIPVTPVTAQSTVGTPTPVTPVTAQSTVGTPTPVTPVTAQLPAGTTGIPETVAVPPATTTVFPPPATL